MALLQIVGAQGQRFWARTGSDMAGRAERTSSGVGVFELVWRPCASPQRRDNISPWWRGGLGEGDAAGKCFAAASEGAVEWWRDDPTVKRIAPFHSSDGGCLPLAGSVPFPTIDGSVPYKNLVDFCRKWWTWAILSRNRIPWYIPQRHKQVYYLCPAGNYLWNQKILVVINNYSYLMTQHHDKQQVYGLV